MKLNKLSYYCLLYLLRGLQTSADIHQRVKDVDIRSIQRALGRLTDAALIERRGPINNPSYTVRYDQLLTAAIPGKILEDEARPASAFNHAFLAWLAEASEQQLGHLIAPAFRALAGRIDAAPMTRKALEHLTVELSWKSSALEGNTYTLLDTQLLLTEGIKARNHTEFETQMILNHKNAIGFVVEHPELFSGPITLAALEDLHTIISKQLGIARGIRKQVVKITASNYAPLANPHQLRENAERVLGIINQQQDPVLRGLLALSLVPYLQYFEDGNKRLGRILANAILISTVGSGFSLRRVGAKELALAYLAFYEFNSIAALAGIFNAELG